jgi:phosphate uptake regulator
MLQELLSIFRAENPLNRMGAEFADMLRSAGQMTVSAGDIYFGMCTSHEHRTEIYETDIRVNKLERGIRKDVVAHLSLPGNRLHLPYCLLLMSLVKDVERIGDYAKNLSEVVDLHDGPLPDDDIVAELKEIRSGVERALNATSEVFAESDRERALNLILHGKDLAQRADGLLMRIARASHDSGKTIALALGVRYYKRIGGHLLNVLSSVVMPLHKIDYYDEDEIPGPGRST